MRDNFPDKFDAMAEREHRFTDIKGKPVTISKDQSKKAKKSGNILVFLKKHPDYPNLKSIDDMEGVPPEDLFDCNGFCGLRDLWDRKDGEYGVNFESDDSPQLTIFSKVS